MPVPVVTHRRDLPTLAAALPPGRYRPEPDGAAEAARQLQVYVDLGLWALAGLDEDEFRAGLAPLAEAAAGVPADPAPGVPADDHVPFVLVPEVLARRPNDAVPAMRRATRTGMSVIDDAELATYRPLPAVAPPAGTGHLLTGVETGSRYLSVTPEDALADLTRRGRTPLTVAEGLALVIVRPDMLRPGRCFSLAGSRTGTNQRVPALWISQRRPKLGWCWDRNPHTWLGTASATARGSR